MSLLLPRDNHYQLYFSHYSHCHYALTIPLFSLLESSFSFLPWPLLLHKWDPGKSSSIKLYCMGMTSQNNFLNLWNSKIFPTNCRFFWIVSLTVFRSASVYVKITVWKVKEGYMINWQSDCDICDRFYRTYYIINWYWYNSW